MQSALGAKSFCRTDARKFFFGNYTNLPPEKLQRRAIWLKTVLGSLGFTGISVSGTHEKRWINTLYNALTKRQMARQQNDTCRDNQTHVALNYNEETKFIVRAKTYWPQETSVRCVLLGKREERTQRGLRKANFNSKKWRTLLTFC